METSQVETLLRDELKLDEVIVKANGSHYEVIAVGECFDGLSRVKKQQLGLCSVNVNNLRRYNPRCIYQSVHTD